MGEEPRRLDLRLLLPALLAWAVLVAVLPHPPWVAGLVAAGAALTALACLGLRTRVRDRVLVLGFAGAAVALVCGSGALHLAAARSGPVPDWAAQGAVTQARLLVTTEPRVIARGDERQPLVVLEATVLEARSRGQVSTPRTPVVVFAGDPAWAQVRWRSEVLTQGRWAPAEPGQRAVAVLTPRGPPETAGEPLALLRGVDHVRDRFRTAVGPLPTDPRGLVPGLVIGDTSLTPPDLTQAMRDTGMTHLSAVSGSKV